MAQSNDKIPYTIGNPNKQSKIEKSPKDVSDNTKRHQNVRLHSDYIPS